MATLNFPDNPSTGDEYYDSNAGFNYEWNGVVWITKDLATPNNTREIDDISSGFDGSDTTFTLQVNGVNIAPLDVKQLVISVGGVMQNPGDDYTVSGSTLTFTSAPSSGLSFTGTFLGAAASLNTITAGSVSPSSLTTTSNYTVGSIKVSGASTIGNFVLTGLTTITDPDVTNLSSSGVGTVSNVIITGDNSGLGATIGAAVGVVTYYGDGSNMTGVGLSMFPLSYDPGISSTTIATDTNIVTTWNYPIQAGSGTITIRSESASGTIVDQFVVGSSSSITISERTLTLNPAITLSAGVEYFVNYPEGAVKSTSGQKENDQLIYSFTTKPITLWGWGNGGTGNLGQNTSWPSGGYYSSPIQIAGTTWDVPTGTTMGVANAFLKTDGTLWSMGNNNSGQLGQNQGPSSHLSSPTQVGTDTTWAMVNGTQYAMFATKTDGTLWAWGRNNIGHLGLNSTANPANNGISSPTQVGTDTTWNKVFGSNGSEAGGARAMKTDGTSWSWGYNSWGQLGLNQGYSPSTKGLSSPTQLPGTWSKFTGGGAVLQGIKTDGTLWVCGYGGYGTLGQNDRTNRSSPVQIPGTWSDASAGNTAYAIKTDGTLWSWGYNTYGSLGLNEAPAAKRSSPTQVGTDTTWSEVQKGVAYTVVARKTDNTLWAWGNNNYGEQGLNDKTQRSSPTQIPGTWLTISGADYQYFSTQ